MNTLKIILSYHFASKMVFLTWYDMLFGLDNGFFSDESVVEKSYEELEKNDDSSELVLSLAISSAGESVRPLIEKLAENDKNRSEKITKDKFLYLTLSWLYAHKEQFSDPLDEVATVYADFGYPEKISNFIKYMPSSDPDLGSLERNRERLFKNWRKFLDSEQKKYR